MREVYSQNSIFKRSKRGKRKQNQQGIAGEAWGKQETIRNYKRKPRIRLPKSFIRSFCPLAIDSHHEAFKWERIRQVRATQYRQEWGLKGSASLQLGVQGRDGLASYHVIQLAYQLQGTDKSKVTNLGCFQLPHSCKGKGSCRATTSAISSLPEGSQGDVLVSQRKAWQLGGVYHQTETCKV